MKINIVLPKGNLENKEWIENIIKVSIKSLSESIKIYFKIEIQNCNIKLIKRD